MNTMNTTPKIGDKTSRASGYASYREIRSLLANREPFQGHSMSAYWQNGTYVVLSYATVIATDGPDGVEIIDNRWGPTTGRHINLCKTYL